MLSTKFLLFYRMFLVPGFPVNNPVQGLAKAIDELLSVLCYKSETIRLHD